MTDRLSAHAELVAWFEERTDFELTELLGHSEARPGWGVSRILDVAGHRVFAKTIPVTKLELAHLGSTRNLFELPVVYNYGVGSAGFGAAREVAAHVLTTRTQRLGSRRTAHRIIVRRRPEEGLGLRPVRRPNRS